MAEFNNRRRNKIEEDNLLKLSVMPLMLLIYDIPLLLWKLPSVRQFLYWTCFRIGLVEISVGFVQGVISMFPG